MYIFRQKSFSTPKIDLISKLDKWKQDNWVKKFPSHWISFFYTPIWIKKENENLVGVIKIKSDDNNKDNQINIGVYLGKGGNLLKKTYKGSYSFDNSPFSDMDNLEPYNELDFKRDLITNLKLRVEKVNKVPESEKIKMDILKNLNKELDFINKL